ncbi:DNA primase [Niallia endozanthoxylica]|uniref:DNA primase n=1 Tax=Niallia endozanthoxylica TaxID=2036016 RepID=A0A5J5HUU5_9BACI|nr:DNA primase [Niallia endozanthoxylica]KAA9026339.1 DNA primase [Niallia endozanthoxylica]
MSDRIAEEKLNQIRQASDIVDVISEFVQLKKQGRNYIGLCPFHNENSPSFSVSVDKQVYHCFGCGAGGNVFSFLMQIEGLSFQEAAVKLAQNANIELEMHLSGSSKPNYLSDEGKQMIEAHNLLRKFYHHLLVNTKEGQHALEYLLERGFDLESIERFQIGYALDSWDFDYKFLTNKNFQPALLEKAGLIIKREQDGSYFDRFRDRIMFPIADRHGETIAFSGRSLGAQSPKYLNSPETAIFNKSKTLYNYHLARPTMRKLQQAILFEGFADVIAADRSGVLNGIATMGTSLTEEHVSTLKKNVQVVTICYDSDSAGIEAAFRAGNMLQEANLQVNVATMPDGMDPDDYVKRYGAEKFRNDIIHSNMTFMSFKMLYYRKGKNLQNEGDRLLYIEKVLQEVSHLENLVEKDFYIRQLAEEFNLSLDALKEQERQYSQSTHQKEQQHQNRMIQAPSVMLRKAERIKPAYHNAERFLIAHMMRSIDVTYKVQELMKGNHFNIDEHQAIITYLYGFYEKNHQPDLNSFLDYINDEKLRRIVVDIEMMPINEEISDQELNDYIKQVLKYQKLLKIKEKEAELREADRQKDISRAVVLLAEIQQIRKTL